MKQYLYISIACFVISAWLLTIIFSGCAFNPRPDCLQTIEDVPCIPGIYMCQYKSRDACKCLREHGYDAHVIVWDIEGTDIAHIGVEIIHEGETYWYDPTWVSRDPKYGCWKTSLWTDRKVIGFK